MRSLLRFKRSMVKTDDTDSRAFVQQGPGRLDVVGPAGVEILAVVHFRRPQNGRVGHPVVLFPELGSAPLHMRNQTTPSASFTYIRSRWLPGEG